MAKSSIIDPKTGSGFVLTSDAAVRDAGNRANAYIDAVSVSQVLSNTRIPMRNRAEIYDVWLYMMLDPIVSPALKLLTTNALGAHESTSAVVFIEAAPNITPAEKKLVDELIDVISPYVNRDAYQLGFKALAFGDAYSRVRGNKKEGIVDVEVSDFYMPQLVQPFEQGGLPAGYQVSTTTGEAIALSAEKIARLKLPRMAFMPQSRTLMNHWHQSIAEDDVENLPMLPDTVGGSILEAAEIPFKRLQNALTGLDSARILDSVREYMMGINMKDMTGPQQDKFMAALTSMLKVQKMRAAEAIKSGAPISEKVFHLIPTWEEKQLYSIDQGGSVAGPGQAQVYTIDDVMVHVKMLAGSLGVDASLVGFADLLSGGLGEGGFFRTSAQAAEAARVLRVGMTSYVNYLIDIHTTYKYGGMLGRFKRPYTVNFVGSSTALDSEQQATRERKTQASLGVLQAIDMLRQGGVSEKVARHFLKDQMGFDEDDANLYAEMVKAAPMSQGEGIMGEM